MVFSSMVFLWILLPVILLCYYISPRWMRNGILAVFSLIFYAWGEPKYIILMVISVLINYCFGLMIERQGHRKICLVMCILLNLLIIGYFKYFNFFVRSINGVLGTSAIPVREIALPIGISFYTFQALSYVVDVYRGENRAQGNFLDMLLYISFFPQLIAGPIVKYHDIEQQLRKRAATLDGFVYGIKRFILGLGKKVVLANTFAVVVDAVYACDPRDVAGGLLWLNAFLYMLQIYFDFSGYSDMAIGLGKMFGFTFQENFDLPYTAVSVRDFWRKWHISLSGWFREYVYIPLGGNRRGVKRTYINLLVVFFLTGIWHGAGWTFVAWGIYHGFFIILERMLIGRWLEKGVGRVFGWCYTMVAVFFGWILFRADTITQAASYIYYMFVPHRAAVYLEAMVHGKELFLAVAAVFAGGLIQKAWEHVRGRAWVADSSLSAVSMAGYLMVMWTAIVLLVNDTYNPFIYFRF